MFSSQSQMESGMMRFRSAPSSFVETLVGGSGDEFDQPSAPENLMGRFFSGDSSCLTSEPSCRVAVSTGLDLEEIEPSLDLQEDRSSNDPNKSEGLGIGGVLKGIRSDGGAGGGGGGGGVSGGFSPLVGLGHVGMSNFTPSSDHESSLTRQTSSPAGFLTNAHLENGYSLGGGLGNFSLDHCSSGVSQMRLKSQLSFSGHDVVSSPKGGRGGLSMHPHLSEAMSRMAEIGDSTAAGNSSSEDGSLGAVNKSFLSSSGFPLTTTSWEDSHPTIFGGRSTKRGRDLNVDLIHGLIHSQERRTRISEKLRKLEELMPNMDKQTNTADMLNLAVQYIETLQNDVQKFTKERANCTCSSKRDAKS